VEEHTDVAVACSWCGFFSRPGGVCDVCGSPLEKEAPRVSVEDARKALATKARPASAAEERDDPWAGVDREILRAMPQPDASVLYDEVEAAQLALWERQASLERREKAFDDQREALEGTRAALRERGQQLQAAVSQAAAERDEFERRLAEVAEREARAAEREAGLSEREVRAAERDAGQAARDAEIGEREAALLEQQTAGATPGAARAPRRSGRGFGGRRDALGRAGRARLGAG
jgi:uncharacterized protein (DUF3084 family)